MAKKAKQPEQQEETTLPAFHPEIVALADLKPHPRNYLKHPQDEIEHIKESIRANGIYRNIVTAREFTILAGHGVKEAAGQLGYTHVPIIRLDLDPNEPRALKVLAGDNEISHLREIDDRQLTEILKEVKDTDITGLLGTGYDEMMLANLVMVTRPASEIEDFDEAAEWVGVPEYEDAEPPLKISVSFRNEKDRAGFLRVLGVQIAEGQKYMWYPPRKNEDLSSVRFEQKK